MMMLSEQFLTFRNVQDKAKVLADKVKHANETKDYREVALRIIDGLALHRLTISVYLCANRYNASRVKGSLMPLCPCQRWISDFLLVTTETILKAISSAVNGQFISHNQDNDSVLSSPEKGYRF
jgi:hypothetical protein